MNEVAEKLEENIEDTMRLSTKHDFDIEIVDDTPEEDRVAKRKETNQKQKMLKNDDEA